MNRQGPIGGRYRLSPSAETLWVQPDEQLRAMQNFTIMCGEQFVQFLEPIDVRNLNCERAVQFENGVVHFGAVPQISGKRTKVCIRCGCTDVQKAQDWCASSGVEFCSFDGRLLEFLTTVPK